MKPDAPSDCGHPQPPPTDEEIKGCPEIIVRSCADCGRELWWNIDTWRTVVAARPKRYQKLWTVARPPGSFPLRPAEVIWDADDAEELLSLARYCGYVTRGPYVLERTDET